jgi:hypothetical protein
VAKELAACLAALDESRREADRRALNDERTAIGLRSLLPPPDRKKRKIDEGCIPSRFSLTEERIDFKADGRVCGVEIVMDKSGGHYAFFGTWKVEDNALVENDAAGKAPISLGRSTSRWRKIVHGQHVAQRGAISFEGPWPNRYELASSDEAATFLFHDDSRRIAVAELPDWCFR